MQRTKRNRALKPITSSTKSSIASKSLDKENIANQSTPKESIRKEKELSKIESQTIRSIEKDELINGRHCLPRRSHESVSEFDVERLNRGMIHKPIARTQSVAKETRDDVLVVSTAVAFDTAVSESRPSEHVFSSTGSAFEPNFPL